MTLFPMSELSTLKNDPRLPRCGRCGLLSGCKSPRMPVTGEGKREVLVVAEAPGEEEDKRNTQLIGPSGRTLRKHLRKVGVDLDRDCWKTNAVICCPHRNPTTEEVTACRPNLLKTIRELNPKMILLLGGQAIASLIGWMLREEPGAVGRWAGWRIPSQRLNTWICPTWHPSYVMRAENAGGQAERNRQQMQVVSVMFDRHLRRAFELRGRPWRKLPEFAKQVKVEILAGEAAKLIRRWFCRSEQPVAFDFETDMLKPDSEQSKIVSCAMSEGDHTLAFLVVRETREAVVEFLRSRVPKVAHNAKFEDRWARRVLGVSVRSWHWDTMQAAHVLDNRRGVSGLKFQAFVQLGQEPYNETVAPFLEGSSNVPNRVTQADAHDLLLYNGLDALLTWSLYRKQRKDLDAICTERSIGGSSV